MLLCLIHIQAVKDKVCGRIIVNVVIVIYVIAEIEAHRVKVHLMIIFLPVERYIISKFSVITALHVAWEYFYTLEFYLTCGGYFYRVLRIGRRLEFGTEKIFECIENISRSYCAIPASGSNLYSGKRIVENRYFFRTCISDDLKNSSSVFMSVVHKRILYVRKVSVTVNKRTVFYRKRLISVNISAVPEETVSLSCSIIA